MEKTEIYGLSNYQDVARNDSLTIATSNTLISPSRNNANPRKVLMIRNISADNTAIITINLGAQTATANTGIVLKYNESFVDATGEGYECFQGNINGITTIAASGTISIMER